MITKTAAVKMSIRKWTALAKGEQPERGKCGFCEYVKQIFEYNIKGEFEDAYCKEKCPLYPDICSNGGENKLSLYWQYRRSANIKFAQQILDAIIERGEKWVKNER